MKQMPLPPSAEKQALFTRLALTEEVHGILLQEAQQGMDRLSQDPVGLTSQSKANPSVKVPYKWGDLTETAKHQEMLAIVNNASDLTKPYYAMGRVINQVTEENWVARWYLWHSFRYRDNRSKRTQRVGHVDQASTATSHARAKFYDAVHDTYR